MNYTYQQVKDYHKNISYKNQNLKENKLSVLLHRTCSLFLYGIDGYIPHDHKMIQTANHNKDMKNFMATKIRVYFIKHW